LQNKKFNSFQNLKSDFRKYAAELTAKDSGLISVYNEDLDRIDHCSTVRYILIADNPGKEEAAQHRYLIGHSGRQARNFFEDNGLVSEFTSEVIVLNKTCLHTNSTTELRKFKHNELFADSQRFMAEIAYQFHRTCSCEMWIVGCSELHNRGIFSRFTETLSGCYIREKDVSLRNKIRCYKHFSYGNFSHDLKSHPSPDMNIKLKDIGTGMRIKYLGW